MLKGCPFCGGFTITYKDDLGLRVFRCQDCGLVAKFRNHLFDDEDDAEELWNRREIRSRNYTEEGSQERRKDKCGL